MMKKISLQLKAMIQKSIEDMARTVLFGALCLEGLSNYMKG